MGRLNGTSSASPTGDTGIPPFSPVSLAESTTEIIEQLRAQLEKKEVECQKVSIELKATNEEVEKLQVQNSILSENTQKYQSDIKKLTEKNSELIEHGYNMSIEMLDIMEKKDNISRLHFGFQKESVDSLSSPNCVGDPLSEDEQEKIAADLLSGAKKDNILFFQIQKHNKDIEAARKSGEVNMDVLPDPIFVTGAENFGSVQSSQEELDQILGVKKENGSSSNEGSQLDKDWVRRRIGQRAEIVENITEHRYICPLEDGTVIELTNKKETDKDRIPVPNGPDGKPMKLVGFKEVHTETAPRISFVMEHYLQPSFKASIDKDADIQQAKIDLQKQLGDKFIVSGAKKAEKDKAEGIAPPPPKNARKREIFVAPDLKKVLIKGCYAAPAMLALLIVMKFVLMVPVNRLFASNILFNAGFNVPLSTLEHWPLLVFNARLSYLIPFFQEFLVSQKYLHADETTIQCFGEEGRSNTTKSYFWLYSTIKDCPTQVRLFDYSPGRSGEYACSILDKFRGFLITDAYQGYNLLKNVIHCFCMIHARRKFYEVAAHAQIASMRTKATAVVKLFDQLFIIEDTLQSMTAEERLKKRIARMTPIVNQLVSQIETLQHDPLVSQTGKLMGAVNYFLSHKTELLKFLEDGNVPLHNMVAENAIRPIALGRKNWLFCGSPEAAKAIAGIFSIIETAKANGLDPFKYLCFYLENTRGIDLVNNQEYLRTLLPWGEKAQAACRKCSTDDCKAA